jgi:hypothetical protein
LKVAAVHSDSSEEPPSTTSAGMVWISNLLPGLATLTLLRCLSITSAEHASHSSGVAAALQGLAVLSELTLCQNHIRGGLGDSLRTLARLPQLRQLRLIDNKCADFKACGPLRAMSALTQLEVQGDHSDAEVDVRLMGMLAAMPALRQLSLCDMRLTELAMQYFGQSCRDLSSLQSLQLVQGNRHDAVMSSMLHALPSPSLLTRLQLDVEVSPHGASDVLTQLTRFRHLQELDLKVGRELGETGGAAWSRMPLQLGLATGLRSLCIRDGQVGRDGAPVLAAALARLPQLSSLRLPGTLVCRGMAGFVREQLRSPALRAAPLPQCAASTHAGCLHAPGCAGSVRQRSGRR